MPVRQKLVRGVQDIRTHAGKVDRSSSSYMVFMKITALEMERTRKLHERDSAVARLRILDERIQEIEREKADLLEGLNVLGALRAKTDAAEGKQPSARAAPSSTAEGFRFAY